MKSAPRLLVALPVFLSGFLVGPQPHRAVWAGDTMSPNVAAALGLEEVWRRQLQVRAGAQSIADQTLYVHEEDHIEYVELRQTGGDASVPADDESRVLLRIPINQVSKEGLPVDKEEAQRQARAEIRRLKRRGITAEIAERKVARVNLLTICDDGTLECRNAENGSTIWISRIGDQSLPFGTIGVNDKYVTVTNGGNLIKLSTKDGTEINSTRTSGTPLFGSMISGDYALVATIRRAVEGYPLHDTTREPFMEIVAGRALAPPTKAPGTSRVAWGTDRGFVYCMELSGEPSVIFRLETDGIVGGRLASAEGDRFFFGSENGQVYGMRATREGKILWSRPYGEPFYNAPLVVDDQLLIRSAYGNLYSLGVKDGISTWQEPIPSVDELIAAFDGKVYVRTLGGSVSVIDLKSGKTTAAVRSLRPEKLLVNRLTKSTLLRHGPRYGPVPAACWYETSDCRWKCRARTRSRGHIRSRRRSCGSQHGCFGDKSVWCRKCH